VAPAQEKTPFGDERSSELLDVERSLLLRTRAGTGATGGVCGVHKRSDDERVLKAIPFARSIDTLNDWAFPFLIIKQ